MGETELNDNRMVVVFSNTSGPEVRAFGPYRVVQIHSDAVWVFEGLNPFRIAISVDGRWATLDGMDDGATFDEIRVLTPAKCMELREIEDWAR